MSSVLQRAFESVRAPGKRLFCDPYAAAFLRPGLRVLAEALLERVLPTEDALVG
jgi:hypothetical protein